jgi:hypothetical protein
LGVDDPGVHWPNGEGFEDAVDFEEPFAEPNGEYEDFVGEEVDDAPDILVRYDSTEAGSFVAVLLVSGAVLAVGLALESGTGVKDVFGEDEVDWSDFWKGTKGFFSPLGADWAVLAFAGSKGMKLFLPASEAESLPDALERYESVFNELLAASDAGPFPVANEGGVDDPVLDWGNGE